MLVHFVWTPVEDWEEIYKAVTFAGRDEREAGRRRSESVESQ